jgi:branched-chain amino acid transport system permease protein
VGLFVQQIVNGLALGSIYALIALGYTMVYGIIRLINFAHGDIYMIGAFVGYFALTTFNLPFGVSLVLAMLIPAILGMLIERVAYRPLRKSPSIAVLITAIGVSLLIENLAILWFSPDPRPFPQIFPNMPLDFFGIKISIPQIIVFLTSVALMIALNFLVQKTKIGKAMRAVSQDKEAASLMGIDTDRIISLTFAIGSALAGAAGVMVGVIYPRIQPLMGVMPGLKAFVSAVLGGIGSIPGAMLGGLIMGLTESLVTALISSTWRDAIAFGLLIVILLVKPSGILGKSTREKV